MATQPLPLLSEEEYLRLERAADSRSEFIDGVIYSMPGGGSARHSQLELNIGAELRLLLKASHFRAFSANLRVRVPSGSELYPDVSVVCGPIRYFGDRQDVLTNPVLLVEVLAPSTANYDRGIKFELYRQISSLRHYLLVHQDKVFAEHYSRNPDESWTLREYRGPSALIPLLDCSLPLGNIYEGALDD